MRMTRDDGRRSGEEREEEGHFCRFPVCTILELLCSVSLFLVSITANVTSRFLARGGQVFVSTTAATSDGLRRERREGGRVVLYVSAVRPWQNPTDRVNEV